EGKDADESDRQKGPAERAVAPSPGRPGHATASREWSKSRKSRAQAITRGGRARKDGRPPGPEHLEMAEVRPGRPRGRFEGAPAVLSAAVGALVGAAPSPLPQPAVEHHLGAAAVGPLELGIERVLMPLDDDQALRPLHGILPLPGVTARGRAAGCADDTLRRRGRQADPGALQGRFGPSSGAGPAAVTRRP